MKMRRVQKMEFINYSILLGTSGFQTSPFGVSNEYSKARSVGVIVTGLQPLIKWSAKQKANRRLYKSLS